MAVHDLYIPLTDDEVSKLALGDMIYLSGPVFTCRSRLQRYIFDEGHGLPFSTENRNVLVHVGPIVIREQSNWKLVSFMPTSSIRFERWGASSVREWGLKAIIGKTTMGKTTARAMRENHCIHACPQCVSPNLWLDAIEIQDVYLFDELGTIEAAWHLQFHQLGPFLVDIDAAGDNYFDRMDNSIAQNMLKAYKKLDIPLDFQFTQLWSDEKYLE